MPKCGLCKRNVKKLVSYGKLQLCNDCLLSYEEQETGKLETDKWLIRTTDGLIMGPFDHEKVRSLISNKKVVFLDEVSRDGNDWNLIKNISSFKDLALKTDYKLSESTVDFDLDQAKAKVEGKKETKPPRFKKEHKLPVSIPSIPEIKEVRGIWKRPTVVTAVVVLIAIVVGIVVYTGNKKDSPRFVDKRYGTATSDYFNRYYIKGREYEEAGLFKEAMEHYRKALAAAPNNSGVRIRKAAIDLMVLSNTEEASKALQELYAEANVGKISDQEEQSDIKTFLGLLEFGKKNYQAAIGYFNQALAIKPTNAYLYYNIGRVMFLQQNYSGALEYFRNAKKLSASFSDAAYYEGLSMLRLNRYREAANIFSEGQEQNPNTREFYTFGAYAAMRSSNLPKAYAMIKDVLTIDPYYFRREFTPLFQLPKENPILEELTYTEELLKALDEKQKGEGFCVLALLNLIKGTPDEGLKILSSTIQLDTSEKLMSSGIIYFHQQKYEDAKKKIDRSLELDYSNNLAHLYAGQIALKNNDIGQARNHFTKAQSAEENTSLYAITLLGDIYLRSGEKNAAILLWKKVLSLDARYVPAWERILTFND